MRPVEPDSQLSLDDYAASGQLALAVDALRAAAKTLVPRLDVRWLVMETNRPEFFALTKRIHNMIHGATQQEFTASDRALYEDVSRANAEALLQFVRPDDVLLVHDPQPLGAGARVKLRHPGLRAVWRCHIGLEEDLPVTRAAWEFLRPYASVYDRVVFSIP